MRFLATVTVSILDTVNDPQGVTVAKALTEGLKFTEVESVRVNKSISITLTGEDEDQVGERIKSMCEKLLANPVIETYKFTIATINDKIS